MKSFITPQIIANNIRMNCTQFHGSFLLVEGGNDARLFKNYIDPVQCKVEFAINKDNAIKVLDILERDNFKRILVVVDADFDQLEGKLPTSQNLLYTDHHDLDVMLFHSQALEKVLVEFGSPEKIKKFQEQSGKDIRTTLIEAGKIIGYLRWVSLQQKLNLSFENLNFSKFVKTGDLTIDRAKLIKVVKDHSQNPALDELGVTKELETKMNQLHDALQVCCGHDLTAILSVALRKTIGTNDRGVVDPEQIEKSLRLAFESSFLSTTQLYQSIRRWEQNNSPCKILRSIL